MPVGLSGNVFGLPEPAFWGLVILAYLGTYLFARTRALQVYRQLRDEASLLATALPFETNQPWRKRTDIRLLEELKARLQAREKRITELQPWAAEFVSKTDPTEVDLWRTVWEHRYLTVGCCQEASALRERLDLLWAGEAHAESEDRRDEILKLRRKRENVPDDHKKQDTQLSYDERIIELERELRDIEQLKQMAGRRHVQLGPHEVKYHESRVIDELDMREEVDDTYRSARTEIEAIQAKHSLHAQVEAGTFTEEERARLHARIDGAYEEKFSTASRPSNEIRIHKREG